MNATAALSKRSNLKDQLDAALNAGASASDLMAVVSGACSASPNAAWEALALVDQYYRRRRIDQEVYRSLKAHVERLALGRPAGSDRPVSAPAGAMPEASMPRPVPTRQPVQTTADTGSFAMPPAAATPPAPRTLGPPRPGMLLRDRYRLEARLDYGNGVVFQALDEFRKELPEAEQRVAIRFPADAADAQREFFRAQHLSHPNIARVIEFDRDGDTAFYTMELLQGRLLLEVLKHADHLPLPRAEALAIIRDIGAALQHAHSRDVVHGRLHTGSVLITQDGGVRVLNFGLPRHEHESVSPADDLRGLCLIAYELFAGRPAFDGRSPEDARLRRMKLKRPAGLHRRQWRALQRGLATSGKGRSITIAQWVADLEVQRAPVHASAPNSLMHTPRPPAWPRQLLLGGVLIAFAAALFTIAVNWQTLLRTAERTAENNGRASGVDVQAPIARNTAPTAVVQESAIVPASVSPPAMPGSPSASTAPVAEQQSAALPSAASPSAALVTGASPASSATPAASPAISSAPSPAASGSAAASSDTGAGVLGFQAESFTVAPGEAAARVPVRRTVGTRGDVGFVWWTEDGSAHGGDDYVSFGEQRELIPAGQKNVSLYVPLSGNARPAQSEFYLNIGEASGGARLGRITRLRIIIAADE